MVRGIFSWHTLVPLVPIEHRLNITAYLSIIADHVHPFMTTVYPSSDGYFLQDNAPYHKAQIISDWLYIYIYIYKKIDFFNILNVLLNTISIFCNIVNYWEDKCQCWLSTA